MTSKVDSDAIASFATLTNSISSVTSLLSNLGVCLSATGTASPTAALQIADLSQSAAQLAISCQAARTCCQFQPNRASTPGAEASPRSSIQHVFFFDAAILGAARLWKWAGKALLPFVPLVVAKGLVNSLREWVLSLSRTALQWELVATVLDGAAALVAALATTEGAILAGLATGGAAVLGGISYLLWRHWRAIVRAIRKVSSIVAEETRTFLAIVASAVGEVVGTASEDMPRRVDARRTSPDAAPPRNRFASESPVAGSLITAVPSLASLMRPESVGFRAANIAVRTAAAAMLMTPLLVAPATADVASFQPRTGVRRAASVVINSTPTITINASDCGDIEQRVLEALRKHREELYAQWCNELQRRQRTEF